MVGVCADPVTAQVMMTLRAGMLLLLGPRLRGGSPTMRTAVASSETVLPRDPVVKGPRGPTMTSAEQRGPDLLGGPHGQRSELPEPGDRHPADRPPDAEDAERPVVEVEDRCGHAVQVRL